MTIRSKNISFQASNLLDKLHKAQTQCFHISTAYQLLTNSNSDAVKKLLSDMTKRGLLLRIKGGIYYVIPYEQDPKTFMPDWHLVAEALVNEIPYYIGYYSALQIHNLITQPSLKEQIVVAKQQRPSQIDIKGVTFQFIFHNQEHFFGAKKIWIDSFNKVMCSDLEKTFIDCLFKPDYAGGIVEIAKAIYLSKDKINFERLYNYALLFNAQAVIKRLGFLLELLEIETEIIQKLQEKKTNSYVLLDTELPKQGKRVSRWGIQQNIELETIKSAILT